MSGPAFVAAVFKVYFFNFRDRWKTNSLHRSEYILTRRIVDTVCRYYR